MSDQSAAQAPATPLDTGYAPKRTRYAGAVHHPFNNQGAIILTQNTLANMRDLKSALPPWPQANNDLGTTHRQSYNNPFMVLPTGRAIPPPACSRQHQTSGHDASTPVSCLPLDMFPKLNGKTGMGSAGFPNYGWPYDLPSNITTLDPIRRGYWSPDDKNTSFIFPPIGAHGRQDYYPRFPYVPAPSSARQCYMAGSIQPMKRADNKSYEMVNLDELVNQNPPIPRAVPALWTNQAGLSLGQCLQNPEGVTNVYIRGFMPETTDHHLECWASRFGQIESCKAIIEQDTGKCKGFGFVMFCSLAAAENCIRGFFHLGFQASFAQKPRNSRLKDLEDKNSTNIYCTGVPIGWNESDLAKHFLPYHAVSTKICRGVSSGMSKEVGFARFETREVAEEVIKEFHGILAERDGVKLFLRFADTEAQKKLKQQTRERRNWRSREYRYSVEHTPSPTWIQSPTGTSPAGTSTGFTPGTSLSPLEPSGVDHAVGQTRSTTWPMQGDLQSITSITPTRPTYRTSRPYVKFPPNTDLPVPTVPDNGDAANKTKTPSSKKVAIKIEPASAEEDCIVTP